jgi:outer membrane immunogenic protein
MRKLPMKRFILAACAGLLAAAMASPSFAADMPGPYVAPAYSPAFNWTGFYAGINGGYAFGKSNWTDTTGATTGDFDLTGALAGGTIGYNVRTGSWVWGFEADGAASWLKGSDAAACCETKNDWFATARGRFGFAFGQWLPFVTAGAAFGDVKMTAVGFGSATATKIGWTAGGGLEYAFMGAWSAKVEYLYADLGKASCGAAACGLDTDVTFKTSIVRAGVNYHF